MDEVTKDIRKEVVKEMLYADDIVLVGDNWEEVESRYTQWKKTLREKGMKINVNKTKLSIQEEILYECKCESIHALYVAKE